MWPKAVRVSVLGRSLRLTYNDRTTLTEETLLQAPGAGIQLEQGSADVADHMAPDVAGQMSHMAGHMAADVAGSTAGTSWDEVEAAVGLWPCPPPSLPGNSIACM